MFATIGLLAFLAHGVDLRFVGDPARANYADDSSTSSDTRLPDQVQPWLYDLTISTDLQTSTFNGSVYIMLKVTSATSDILLHCKDLKIKSVELVDYSRDRNQPISVIMDPKNEIMNISSTNGKLQTSTYWRLTIEYSGNLSDDRVGFYRSSYMVGGKPKLLAATQFEATYARTAFPCFDEPKFKALFRLHLYTGLQQRAISNLPEFYSIAEGSKIRHEFSYSPPMPTYLVSFMISDMSIVNSTDWSKKYRVWTRENAISSANYALETGPKCIQAMEKYTGVQYMLPKMDLVTVPDMSFGAMENWGMITFRESAMLFNKTLDSEKNLQRVTLVIAHETVHQWFGDYVTPYWWDYVWLNEGFATLFEYKVTAMIQPAWRMDEFFVVRILQPVLFEDGASLNHAMTSPVNTPTEIDDHFDMITYEKGGSILRMLESIVSPEIFKTAITQYLKTRYQDNGLAQPSDLWNAFEVYCNGSSLLPRGYNITKIMTEWTTYTGYPLVKVNRDPSLSSRGSVFILQQEPYDASYRSISKSVIPKGQSWAIPITYTTNSSKTSSNLDTTLWLLPGQNLKTDEPTPSNDWILVNLQQTGYYRVNYDLENWNLLVDQLMKASRAIHVLNRAQLIDDSWTLAIDNKLPYSVPFSMAYYLVKEEDVLPWYSAINKFEYVYSLFEYTAVKEPLRNYLLERVTPLFNRLGFNIKETDDHLTKVLRGSVISFACRLGSKECGERAEQAFKDNLSDLSRIHAHLKSAAFCAAFNNEHFKESEVWSKLWDLYASTNSAHEKETLLSAVGCMKCRSHLKKYLRKLVDPKDHDIREQDYRSVYQAVLATPYGVHAALQFVDDSTRNITALSPHEKRVVVTLLRRMKHKITTQDHLDILKKLNAEADALKGKLCTKYTNALREAYELGSKRIERIAYKHGEIQALLVKNSPKGHSPASSVSSFSVILMCVGWLIFLQA